MLAQVSGHLDSRGHHVLHKYLILVELLVDEFVFPLLLKRDNDEGHKDVDEEEWKDNEEDYVEYGHLWMGARARPLIDFSGVH